ncbi:MAG: linear amide C-N hydrolase [Candidatus Aminicenantes bacterium]|nr:MAG: linear amide C-N hydrolase [Candidatus Aminicenantes bacterium]
MIRFSKNVVVSAIVGMAFLLSMMAMPSTAQELEYKETVIAGGPDKFAEVRHVVLKGSNFEIGKKIGEIAKRDGTPILPSGNHIMNRAKREYMAKNYPILHERMRGLAAAYGLNFSDDSYDFSGLFQKQMTPSGCSVTFYPASATVGGHNILSRNYDFITGDMTGRKPQKGQLAMMARPILFEIHPDQGYPSLSLCVAEYLGGVLDGINSEGLVVAILADEESGGKVGREPGDEVGMHELMGMRYLLDNCKNVEEAKEALLSLKHYYAIIPCHYIIGDRSGKSFIFEFASARNRSYIIDGDGPQCVTNHLVFHHQKIDEIPETGIGGSLRRYKMLDDSIKAKEKFTIEDIAAINAQVAIPPNAPRNPAIAPGRTLWYAQYDLENLTLTVKFYLGEKPDPENEKRVILEYSPSKLYKLQK